MTIEKFANFTSYPNSGWHRVDSKDIVIFFHTDPIPQKDNPSHRHSDLISFVFYYRGRAIFVDVGRFSYNNNQLGNYGYSAIAHNSLTIDKYEPQALIKNRKLVK